MDIEDLCPSFSENVILKVESMTKKAISIAIHQGNKILLVQRPEDDDDLPLAWGLPASSLYSHESFEDAVIRTGIEKLGVELMDLKELNRGKIQRARYTLEMALYSARLMSEEISLSHQNKSITQYIDWKWGSRNDLLPAAKSGSLCSQLYLEYVNLSFE